MIKPVAWGRVIDGKAVTVSLVRTPANDEPLYAAARIEALEAALRWISAKTDDRLAAEFARAALAPENDE